MQLNFNDQHQFTQAAFIQVSRVVYSYAENIIVGGSKAPACQECLEMLMRVCSGWGYVNHEIVPLYESIKEQNQLIEDREEELSGNFLDMGSRYDH